jgi:hypothetical protein
MNWVLPRLGHAADLRRRLLDGTAPGGHHPRPAFIGFTLLTVLTLLALLEHWFMVLPLARPETLALDDRPPAAPTPTQSDGLKETQHGL